VVRFVLRRAVTWCGEPAGEVALKLGQIVATAVLDVTIAVDARARKHLAVELVQGASVASGSSGCSVSMWDSGGAAW
jgi:hypothetical protein